MDNALGNMLSTHISSSAQKTGISGHFEQPGIGKGLHLYIFLCEIEWRGPRQLSTERMVLFTLLIQGVLWLQTRWESGGFGHAHICRTSRRAMTTLPPLSWRAGSERCCSAPAQALWWCTPPSALAPRCWRATWPPLWTSTLSRSWYSPQTWGPPSGPALLRPPTISSTLLSGATQASANDSPIVSDSELRFGSYTPLCGCVSASKGAFLMIVDAGWMGLTQPGLHMLRSDVQSTSEVVFLRVTARVCSRSAVMSSPLKSANLFPFFAGMTPLRCRQDWRRLGTL